MQIPKQGERREGELQELVKKGTRPVALFVDEAHDLNGHTLIGLKRLMEVLEDGGGMLAVVLAGHPKLRNNLRRPTMEEIGYRTDIFTLDGIAGSQRDYKRESALHCGVSQRPPPFHLPRQFALTESYFSSFFSPRIRLA